ncbi:proton channel OtopLc-like [Adelges cooleyi]|uniref:proton channel OtopLc-like n=1 Tax=Adelges cooleyi TaxID=133065 RepID=UPI00217F9B1C|nr:proton channel OtopLc-like [Adelges cooleyi]
MRVDGETVSWTSDLSNRRLGNGRLATSLPNNCSPSNLSNECPTNKHEMSFKPNSPGSEIPTAVPDSVVHSMSILKIPAPMKRGSTIEDLHKHWREMGSQALATTLSALYGKLLVVMGIAFPMSEVISTHIPHSFYEGYYLYLYFGSMAFLFYMYGMLLKGKPTMTPVNDDYDNSDSEMSSDSSGNGQSDSEYYRENANGIVNHTKSTSVDMNPWEHHHHRRHSSHLILPSTFQHYGSFYLRMGAVAFGIGSMIYSGLEFGQYFELEPATKCHNVLLVLTPAMRMAFIFIQMYFIFLNDEQQMRVTRHRILAKFGLMHMIGTNLSVWLNVLVQETKHEILTFYNPEDNSIGVDKQPNHFSIFKKWTTTTTQAPITSTLGARVARSLDKGPHHIYECRRTNIIGSLVQNASPFLFPCTIEYSLICAAILYVMWKNINRVHADIIYRQRKAERCEDLAQMTQYRKSPHYYSVDCAQAHKGLFVGILFLVLTIISLILFFVLISRPELITFAVKEVNICELSLYGMTTLATIVGMLQVRQLKFDGLRNLELDNILLVGAQTGSFIYSTFTIISGHFTKEHNTILVLITASASLVQTFCQTVFILDASRRSCVTPDQIRKKPGREIVTFLLVSNLAMWAINTLEKSRADSHPIQLHFYGLWAWTIITHVSMPLAIFYRFHSTVCLCEIWKRAYKIKPPYM